MTGKVSYLLITSLHLKYLKYYFECQFGMLQCSFGYNVFNPPNSEIAGQTYLDNKRNIF